LCSLVDTHCHLDFNLFDSDREDVLQRAQEAGMVRILNPGIDLPSSEAALSLADQYPLVYAAIGVHPNDALTWNAASLAELRRLAQHPKVVAIGEIGLDYYRQHAPQDLQMRIFEEQLQLAGELGLPVVIHNREATADLLPILNRWAADLDRDGSQLVKHPGVLHSNSASLAAAREAISLGFMIGFSGPITFQKANELRQTAVGIPLQSILVETDAPFLTPEPYRGRRNEPAYVYYVVEKLAEIHSIPYNATADITEANAKTLFSW